MYKRHSSLIRHLYHSLSKPKRHPKGVPCLPLVFLVFRTLDRHPQPAGVGGVHSLSPPPSEVLSWAFLQRGSLLTLGVLGRNTYVQGLHLKLKEYPPYVPGSLRQQGQSSVGSQWQFVFSCCCLDRHRGGASPWAFCSL